MQTILVAVGLVVLAMLALGVGLVFGRPPLRRSCGGEDCLGLCDQCGADTNKNPCTCARPVDPCFAGLQSLKLPS